jgi:hypothetical protein
MTDFRSFQWLLETIRLQPVKNDKDVVCYSDGSVSYGPFKLDLSDSQFLELLHLLRFRHGKIDGIYHDTYGDMDGKRNELWTGGED